MLGVSIVIPAFNRYLFVAQCLFLLEKQTCCDFEVIVIDDGSTDATSALFSLYWDLSLRYFKVQNGERGAARNLGIKLSRFEYVTFLDSDDLLHPLHVELFLKFLRSSRFPSLIVSGQSFEPLDFSTTKLLDYSPLHDSNTLLRGNPYSCNFSINKTLLPLFFVESREYITCEDWIFLFIAERQYAKPVFLPFVSVQMCEHAGRSMHDSRRVISARKASITYLESCCDMSSKDKSSLIAWSSYFCAIHAYLGNNSGECFSYLLSFLIYRPRITSLILALKLIIKTIFGFRFLFNPYSMI